ncbi:MAG: CoA transferase [bacterium]|nr:CoA transferase [bacterium]MXZ77484.1 CoA transferase [Acidimicrobiia bacterium]MYE74009.1 CoA transferase [Acidimicrobiia bacterium]MYJ62812.1 CoA transferase [Acidimicrobiia bacterium]
MVGRPALDGIQVVDLGWGIAGGYATKLLADAGADVVKVELPEGDPLRGYSASFAPVGDHGPLFRFLNTSKRGVVLDYRVSEGRDRLMDLYDTADLVIERSEPDELETLGVGWEALAERRTNATMVSVSNFGRGGPWSQRPANEFTLMAIAGSTATRGRPGHTPFNAGGRIGEWMGGLTAAVAATAALRRARRTGLGDHVDLSLLETITPTCTNVQTLWGSFTGEYDTRIALEVPSVEPTRDGYVGFCVFTGQQWQDFTVLVGHPEWADNLELATMGGRIAAGESIAGAIREWTSARTTEEVVREAILLRIPVAPIGNGANLPEFDQFAQRGVYVPHPGGEFIQPRVPYRNSSHPTVAFRPAPRLGQHTNEVLSELAAGSDSNASARREGTDPTASPDALPLDGVRVVDMTAFWAGPYGALVLATLGADVIHIESVQRPDGMRFGSARTPGDDQWWEYGPTFHHANVGKRSVTLDLTRPEGMELLHRLIGVSDALVENFSPRVMDQFGLDWDTVHQLNPRLVMVRMPAFGLDGPWRDRVGFAQTMEQVSGMCWLSGYPETAPQLARGPSDPLAGLHAAYAVISGLHARERTGLGSFVEATMVETALNAAAEQVVEYSATGHLMEREANHHPYACPQGVYACSDGQSVAISVEADRHWEGLLGAVPELELDRVPASAALVDRFAARHELDQRLSRWCADQQAADVVERLISSGVPAAEMVMSREGDRNPQVNARGFYEPVEHSLAGTHRFPAMPVRFGRQPDRWFTRPAPTLGEHNAEVLGDLLGVGADELARLEAAQIIGTRPAFAPSAPAV